EGGAQEWERNQVAVGANQEEWIGGGRTRPPDIARQEELVEARRADIEQAETITPRRDLEEGLDHAVHQELVTQYPIQVEQVEHQFARLRIEHLVVEEQRNIEVRKAGQMEAGVFVAGIKLVEQAIE